MPKSLIESFLSYIYMCIDVCTCKIYNSILANVKISVSRFNFATSNTKCSLLAVTTVVLSFFRLYIGTERHVRSIRGLYAICTHIELFRPRSSCMRVLAATERRIILRCLYTYMWRETSLIFDGRDLVSGRSFCAESCKTMRWRRRRMNALKFVYRGCCTFVVSGILGLLRKTDVRWGFETLEAVGWIRIELFQYVMYSIHTWIINRLKMNVYVV